MAFTVLHRNDHEQEEPFTDFAGLVAELDEDPEDEEHPSVSVTHKSDWAITAYSSGLVCFENVEEDDPRYMRGVSREKVLEMFRLISVGDLAALEREPWQRED